jgi:hypothetical protein
MEMEGEKTLAFLALDIREPKEQERWTQLKTQLMGWEQSSSLMRRTGHSSVNDIGDIA